jgi:hypothetical protein
MMRGISELGSAQEDVMLYRHKNDDGIRARWSQGAMQWYRVDNGHYVYLGSYAYWEPTNDN